MKMPKYRVQTWNEQNQTEDLFKKSFVGGKAEKKGLLTYLQ